MNDYKNKFLALIILLLIFSFLYTTPLKAMGVEPLIMDIEAKPGDTKEFELNLLPSEAEETAALNLYSFTQQETGALSYQEGNPDQDSVLNWLDLPEEVTVPPGEEVTVNGEVSVPFEAEGSHTAVVMVEPVVENKEGITLQVRYAVRINVHVNSPGTREKVELKNFELKPDEEDQPIVATRLHNNSSLMYNAAGEVTVRDQNRQLIERVPIRSEYAARNNNSATTIYPGSEVIFNGQITEALTAGTYDLQLFLQYADGRQLIKRKTVEVGDQFVDPENMNYIEIEPTSINEELRRGGAHTQPLDISNRTGEEILIQVDNQKIGSNYQRSLFDNFEVELRGNQQAKIGGRRSERPVLIVRAPREEIAAGGYYDKVKVSVFDPKTEEQLQTKTVDLAFVVGEDFNYAAKIQDLKVKRMGKEVLFSTTVLNQSDLHFAPQARIYLKQNNEIMETINLKLPEEKEYILPEMSGLLNTNVQDQEAGEYTAEVTIFRNEEEITVKEFEVEIAPAEEE